MGIFDHLFPDDVERREAEKAHTAAADSLLRPYGDVFPRSAGAETI